MKLVEFEMLEQRGENHQGRPKLFDPGAGNRKRVLVNPEFVVLVNPGELAVTDTATGLAKVTEIAAISLLDGDFTVYVPLVCDDVVKALVAVN